MAVYRRRLTDANVARLAPAAREYTIWDTNHAGLGLRVRPSGHRSYVYRRKGQNSARRIALGPASLMSIEDARGKCLAIETGARSDRPERGAVPTLHEFVTGPGRACFDRCKPSTRKAVARVFNARLFPAFGSFPLDRITRAGVARWFDEYSRTAPSGANHALSLLRQVLNYAIDCGHLQTNPARSVKRNPSPKRIRFLSHDEIRRPRKTPRQSRDRMDPVLWRLRVASRKRRGNDSSTECVWDAWHLGVTFSCMVLEENKERIS